MADNVEVEELSKMKVRLTHFNQIKDKLMHYSIEKYIEFC